MEKFFKKETLAKVFPCEFCAVCKNTFAYRTHPGTAYEFMLTVFKVNNKDTKTTSNAVI